MTIPESVVDKTKDPSTQSSDRKAMSKWIELVSDVMAGADQVRSRKDKYLPRYPDEDDKEYDRRVENASWRPEFVDILRHLVSKPFEEDVALVGDEVPEQIKAFCEDVDGQGNNLTQFAMNLFEAAVSKAAAFVVVDFPEVPPGVSRADEIKLKARPYWTLVQFDDVVAMYPEEDSDEEVVGHFRYTEKVIRRNGFSEEEVLRVRIYDTGTWEVQEKDPKSNEWSVARRGDREMTGKLRRGNKALTSVPVVPLFLGKRLGVLKTRPPLLELADMQVELYRALSRKDEILTFASSPILVGKGMKKDPSSPVVVGPKTVLYAPPGREGSEVGWEYINPNSANIKEIREDVQSIVSDMKRLGMEPLTRPTGTPTATGESIEAAKAHSTVKAWALRLKDHLEQCLKVTCEWLNLEDTVEVSVYTDFEVLPFAQAPLNSLSGMRASGDISRRTLWDGARRFDVLPRDFDPDREEERLAEEALAQMPDGVSEQDVDPVTGKQLKDPAEELGLDKLESYEDLTEEQLRALVGNGAVDAALGAQVGG